MERIVDEFVEVDIINSDNFLKILETLTRMGIASKKGNTLYQSCHILHKRGRYYIVHFKELFMLDGKPTDFTDEDKARRNTIVNLLAEWNLLEVIDPELVQDPIAPLSSIKIISHKFKRDWKLESKYNIGGKK